MLKISSLKRPVSFAFAASALFATGCANMATTSTSVTSAGGLVVGGRVHGGQQPVSNSAVRLYAVGTNGYGSAPTQYAATTTASDGSGSFSFTQMAAGSIAVTGTNGTPVYSCPATGDPQMYITAKGGNTQGTGNGANSAAAFIIALGKCSTIGAKFADMDEVTTVATMASLQQYFAPANATTDNVNHLGMPTSAQGQLGFANAVGNITNIANLGSGNVQTSTVVATPTGAPAAVTVTITPEVQKINTIADIIGACVNTTSNTSPECNTLFTNAVPPNPILTSQPTANLGTATDTLQALYYMLTNPTSGSLTALTNLYNLQSPIGPFEPTETSVPTDWTIGLRYSSTSTCATGTAAFLSYAYHLAVDATGNLWMASATTGGNLFELGPNGAPLTCTLGASTGVSHGLAIDNNGNVWASGTTNTNLYKYSIANNTSTTWPTGETTGTNFVAIDGNGGIYDSSAAGAALYAFPNGATTTTPFTATQISGTLGTNPYFLGVDTANRIYATDSTTSNNLYQIYPTTATGTAGYLNGYATANVGTSTNDANAYGIQAGLNGSVAVANGTYSASTAAQTLTLLAPTATGGTVTTTSTSAQNAGGLGGAREMSIDGAGNIWIGDSVVKTGSYASAGTISVYSVSEFSATGVALSPNGSTGGFQKDASVLPAAPRGVAVDPSGNVWFGSNSTTGTGVMELVGAAVPVVTPIAAALAAGATTTNGVSKP